MRKIFLTGSIFLNGVDYNYLDTMNQRILKIAEYVKNENDTIQGVNWKKYYKDIKGNSREFWVYYRDENPEGFGPEDSLVITIYPEDVLQKSYFDLTDKRLDGTEDTGRKKIYDEAIDEILTLIDGRNYKKFRPIISHEE